MVNYTEHEKSTIISLRNMGWSYTKISAKIHRGRRGITAFLRGLVENHNESCQLSDFSPIKIIEHDKQSCASLLARNSSPTAITEDTLQPQPRLTSVDRKFTEEQKIIMLELRQQGLSLDKIAKYVHKNRHNVTTFIRESGLVDISSLLGVTSVGRTTIKLSNPPTSTPKKNGHQFQRFDYAKSSHAASASKAKQSNHRITASDIDKFNKIVGIEHRAVIKFLVRLGETPAKIHQTFKKVYGKNTSPDFEAIRYWAAQFQKGRQNIMNDPKVIEEEKRKLAQLEARKAKTQISSQVKKENHSNNCGKVQSQTMRHKVDILKPLKRLSEGEQPKFFKIKLNNLKLNKLKLRNEDD